MNKIFIKKITAAAAAILMVGTSVSCGGKSSESDNTSGNSNNMVGTPGDGANVSPEDMPDGSSTVLMTQTQSGVDLQLEYIPSHISEEESILISRYFYGISTNDVTIVDDCMYPDSMDSLISQELITDTQDYADQVYNMYKEFVGGDFELTYLIEDHIDRSIDFSYYDELVQNTAVEDKKAVAMDLYFKSEEMNIGSGIMRNRMDDYAYIVLYKINGKYYIIG